MIFINTVIEIFQTFKILFVFHFLRRIVERRLVQRNFQLIIITHDEEFLKRLFTVEKVEKYLEVKRDNRYIYLLNCIL